MRRPSIIVQLTVVLITVSTGCDLDSPSREYWDTVEEMYNRERDTDNLNSAINSMNTETYQRFFNFCSCKYDVFLKTETICKYVFIRSFRSSLSKGKMLKKQSKRMTIARNLDTRIGAYEVHLTESSVTRTKLWDNENCRNFCFILSRCWASECWL